jgi:hypothetical protein
MMKHLLLVSLLFLTTFISHAQYDVDNVEESKESKFNWSGVKENIYVGGDVNAILGNVGFIYFAPFIGYEFRAPFSAGISGMVRYLSYGGGVGYFSKGAGVFVRYKPRIPLVVESSFNIYSTSNIEPKRANSWMLGVGYAQSMGERSYTQIMIQYDLLNNDNVPENVLLQLPGGQRLYYKFGIVFYLGD